jgi:DNA-binding NtrC family response regulator
MREADEDKWTLDVVGRRHILSMIEACDGNKSQAASRLQISRSMLYRVIDTMPEKEGL